MRRLSYVVCRVYPIAQMPERVFSAGGPRLKAIIRIPLYRDLSPLLSGQRSELLCFTKLAPYCGQDVPEGLTDASFSKPNLVHAKDVRKLLHSIFDERNGTFSHSTWFTNRSMRTRVRRLSRRWTGAG